MWSACSKSFLHKYSVILLDSYKNTKKWYRCHFWVYVVVNATLAATMDSHDEGLFHVYEMTSDSTVRQ